MEAQRNVSDRITYDSASQFSQARIERPTVSKNAQFFREIIKKKDTFHRERPGRPAGSLSRDYYQKIDRPAASMGYEIGVKRGSNIRGEKLVILRERLDVAQLPLEKTGLFVHLNHPTEGTHRVNFQKKLNAPAGYSRLITRNDGRLIAQRPRIALPTHAGRRER